MLFAAELFGSGPWGSPLFGAFRLFTTDFRGFGPAAQAGGSDLCLLKPSAIQRAGLRRARRFPARPAGAPPARWSDGAPAPCAEPAHPAIAASPHRSTAARSARSTR